MTKHRVAILKVLSGHLTVTQAATTYGFSRQHLHRLLTRAKTDGLDSIEPRSRRPKSNPHHTPKHIHDRIIELRRHLTATGHDAGPVTIAWHLEQEKLHAPSTSTIRRILHRAGLITPEPRKRPKSSYIRFEAAQPNETWQSDFTHWPLADGTDTEILNWLDDHSRYLLDNRAFKRVTGDHVVNTFLATTEEHGIPASTLTDNGVVYTSRFVGGRNAFEHVLPLLGVTQKNGSPGHPQTQGKIERFHQTQKRWLAKQPPAATLEELQTQLDRFKHEYNEQRPHRALDRTTPGQAYRAHPKALPAHVNPGDGNYRIRYDHVSKEGKISLRRAGRMHHLGVGITHKRKPVILIIDEKEVTVVHIQTGEIISTNLINPERGYWRNQQRAPGRWPNTR